MSERILVYNKGGTVASKVENGEEPRGMSGEEMVEQLPPSLRREIEPIFAEDPEENSSDITVEGVVRASRMLFRFNDEVSAAVMPIGANTLLQVASGENYARGRYLPFTRVWCSSQLPFGARKSDASVKWTNAFEIALESIDQGVRESVVMADDNVALRAVTAERISARGFHMFDSRILPPVAMVNGDSVTFADFAFKHNIGAVIANEPRDEFIVEGINVFELFIGYNPHMDLIPGITEGRYNLIIARGYEPKNSPKVLLPAIRLAISGEPKIPFLISTTYSEAALNKEIVGASKNALDAGAIDINGMAHGSDIWKARWMLAQPEFADLKVFARGMRTNFVGELAYENTR